MKKTLSKVLALASAFAMLTACLSGCGSKKVTLKILDTEYANEDYAICVAKENTELLEQINDALAEIKADGTQQKIVDKYISGVEHDLEFQKDAEGKEELHSSREYSS